MTKTVLVIGANGFIGRNLVSRLEHASGVSVSQAGSQTSWAELTRLISECDQVVHLAGVNRTLNESDFELINVEFSQRLLEALENLGAPPVFFSSSVNADQDTPYGQSKKRAELLVHEYGLRTGAAVRIARLPNVFGKWSLPNYNSVVATFAFNISRELPIEVNNPDTVLDLLYVDDLVACIIEDLNTDLSAPRLKLEPIYRISVAGLAEVMLQIHKSRTAGIVLDVGSGFLRAIYATYISFLEPSLFAYSLSAHSDERGIFVEVLKTPSAGQLSFLTVKVGAKRGSHFHHSKVEKFIVVRGCATFKFQNLFDRRTHEIHVRDDSPTVVESIPGWIHEILNSGQSELSVIVWASEVFESDKTDTYGGMIDHR